MFICETYFGMLTDLDQQHQKAINDLTDDEFPKLIGARPNERFHLLSKEQRANFLGKHSKELKALYSEMIPRIIGHCIKNRLIKQKMINDDRELERVSLFV